MMIRRPPTYRVGALPAELQWHVGGEGKLRFYPLGRPLACCRIGWGPYPRSFGEASNLCPPLYERGVLPTQLPKHRCSWEGMILQPSG